MGLSGGVDSAVAAAQLLEQGYEVMGVHLYCYDDDPACTADDDRTWAIRVAKHLGIPLKIWDLRKQYKKEVIRYFFDEYQAGRTPNPDIVCNREIKFGIFMEKAFEKLKVDYIATGHYARIKKDKDGFHLLKGVDEGKDQSYFLYILTQKQLEYILFPNGDLIKKDVRELANRLNLPNKDRPDSQGICFIGPIDVGEFLRKNLKAKTGPVVNTKGEVIGEHDGVWFFTEGQRRGFKIFKPSFPLYVVAKDVASNTLIVGRGEESKVEEFSIEEIHWISGNYEPGVLKRKLFVRIRHLGEFLPVRLKMVDDQTANIKIFVTRGVAPGQSAVIYQGEEVLGGGVIKKVKSSKFRI